MALLQKQFEQFHESIKLNKYGENKILREKREIILEALREGLHRLFTGRNEATPTFEPFNQGSYEMDTGIKPLKEGDYDIDVGLSFNLAKNAHPPVAVKEWVYEALKNHTSSVEVRRPCITVTYMRNGEPIYHVDLAIYSDSPHNRDEKVYLAKGFPGSASENKFWEESDPHGLIGLLEKHFSGDDGGQFKRIIRYLKRWKDLKFSQSGEAAPIGIGITIAVHQWMQVQKKLVDTFANRYEYDDLSALLGLVSSMLQHFEAKTNSDGEIVERLKVTLPVIPYGDLFERMSDKQMASFKTKLQLLQDELEKAQVEPDPQEACQRLQMVFGDDFPILDKKSTGQVRAGAIVSSGSSA